MYRGQFVSKWSRLMLGGKFASLNQLGWLIVGRKFMSVICSARKLNIGQTRKT